MGNNSNNDQLMLAGIIVFILVALTSLRQMLGIDFPTTMQVLLYLIIFGLFISAMIYVTKQGIMRWFSIIPSGVVALLACFRPAFDYWANEKIGGMAFDGRANSVWYATGWIQFLIALAIMVVGHGLIYYFSED